MSFTDTLKRSLGFEEEESNNNKNNGSPSIMDTVMGLFRPRENVNAQNNQQPRQNRNRPYPHNPQSPRQSSGYDDYVITPIESFYEIVLIRLKNIDDSNYVVDQVIEEKNPVILDLSFLEKESEANFNLAGEKIKRMRSRYGAQALLLEHNMDKNLIIVSPRKVKIINKG